MSFGFSLGDFVAIGELAYVSRTGDFTRLPVIDCGS